VLYLFIIRSYVVVVSKIQCLKYALHNAQSTRHAVFKVYIMHCLKCTACCA